MWKVSGFVTVANGGWMVPKPVAPFFVAASTLDAAFAAAKAVLATPLPKGTHFTMLDVTIAAA